MSWVEIKNAYRTLLNTPEDSIIGGWKNFVDLIKKTENSVPYHLKILLNRIEKYRGTKKKSEIVIVDHGCGGALTLLYLAARGYTNIYGFDVGGDHTIQNRVAIDVLEHTDQRFIVNDGTSIPLPDNCVDIVFSQQVIEHVSKSIVDKFLSEEYRILKSSGWAIHQIPHRLTPYDSHTRTWIIHYFPKPLYHLLGRIHGIVVPDHLHLRWPWVHRHFLKKYFEYCEDVTLERLKAVKNPSYYDGPIILRRLISVLISLPIIGKIFGSVLRHFVMLEIVSVKEA